MVNTRQKAAPDAEELRGHWEVVFLRPPDSSPPADGAPPEAGTHAAREAARVKVAGGTHILGAARVAGLPLGAECGGFGKCRCCRVVPLASAEGGHGAPAWLGCPNAAERRQLTEEELAAGWRLACQTPVRGDLTVLAPLPDDQPARKTIDTSLPVQLDPWAERLSLRIEVGEGRSAGALMARALAALRLRKAPPGRPCVDVDLFPRLEPHLSRALAQKTPVTLTLVEGAVVDLEPGDTARRAYGAVVDIGTTHLYAYLIDLATGALRAEVGRPNSQRAWGADLMARVLAATPKAHGGGGAREELTRAVRRDVDMILASLLRQSRVRKRHLVSLTLVGNSVMHHLFLGIPVESLGVAPYVPLLDEDVAFKPRELGLRLPPSARAHFLPLLAGFVGADAVGVALALNLDRPGREKAALALDLGTNVELLLGTPDGVLWCASTPAGPAFEGGEIRCGMAPGGGAIYAMDMQEGQIRLCTIEGLPAAGICGTGLVEVVAGLLDLGVIEPSGRMRPAEELPKGAPEALRRRILESEGGRGFMLEEGRNSASGRPIVLEQWDVRRLQSAKAAVRAGADLLLQAAGLAWEDVGAAYLAGAFGACLRSERARRVGLLPPVPLGRVCVVNNAAASGARLALLSRAELKRASTLKERARYVELAGRPEFQEAFVEALPFPG